MRIAHTLLAVSAATLALSGCTSGGLRGRGGPDEFAVTRNAPLVVPPDFALTPPRPGEPVPTAVDSRGQALQALFGGPAGGEQQRRGREGEHHDTHFRLPSEGLCRRASTAPGTAIAERRW